MSFCDARAVAAALDACLCVGVGFWEKVWKIGSRILIKNKDAQVEGVFKVNVQITSTYT